MHRASALRLIADENDPNFADVPPENKRIEVSLFRQVLTAYEGDKVVLETKVSTGLNKAVPDGTIPWNTPTGNVAITSRCLPSTWATGNITSNVAEYELLGVPWVCYFHVNGNAHPRHLLA